MSIAYEQLMPLQGVLRGLPGVYPIKLTSHLRVLFAGAQQCGLALESPLMLSREDLLSMFARDEDGLHLRVTPYGVKKLVELYEQETLPLRPGVMELRPAPELLKYIASEKDLVAKTLQKHFELERSIRLLHDPGSVTERDFSYDLLHAIFEKHATPKTSVLSVGALRVTRYVSHVAKTGQDAACRSVTFRWTNSDGESRELSR
jgi:hypothetical protein